MKPATCWLRLVVVVLAVGCGSDDMRTPDDTSADTDPTDTSETTAPEVDDVADEVDDTSVDVAEVEPPTLTAQFFPVTGAQLDHGERVTVRFNRPVVSATVVVQGTLAPHAQLFWNTPDTLELQPNPLWPAMRLGVTVTATSADADAVSGTFAAEFEIVSDEIYVDAAAAQTGTGDAATPFKTIGEALVAADRLPSVPVAIYVAAGEYVEQVLITRSDLAIIGAGAPVIRFDAPADGSEAHPVASLVVDRGRNVIVSGVTLRAPAVSYGAAALATSNGQLMLVDATITTAGIGYAYGIAVREGANLVLRDGPALVGGSAGAMSLINAQGAGDVAVQRIAGLVNGSAPNGPTSGIIAIDTQSLTVEDVGSFVLTSADTTAAAALGIGATNVKRVEIARVAFETHAAIRGDFVAMRGGDISHAVHDCTFSGTPAAATRFIAIEEMSGPVLVHHNTIDGSDSGPVVPILANGADISIHHNRVAAIRATGAELVAIDVRGAAVSRARIEDNVIELAAGAALSDRRALLAVGIRIEQSDDYVIARNSIRRVWGESEAYGVRVRGRGLIANNVIDSIVATHAPSGPATGIEAIGDDSVIANNLVVTTISGGGGNELVVSGLVQILNNGILGNGLRPTVRAGAKLGLVANNVWTNGSQPLIDLNGTAIRIADTLPYGDAQSATMSALGNTLLGSIPWAFPELTPSATMDCNVREGGRDLTDLGVEGGLSEAPRTATLTCAPTIPGAAGWSIGPYEVDAP